VRLSHLVVGLAVSRAVRWQWGNAGWIVLVAAALAAWGILAALRSNRAEPKR
jgi:uncharacterized membrane protein